MSVRFKNIIFDFDGTLVDTRPGVVRAFKKVIKNLTKKEIKDEELINLIGTPLIPMLMGVLNTTDETTIKKGSELFKKYYQEDGLYQNVLYPGIKKILEDLKNQSCQLFVVSNKIEIFLQKIMEQHSLKEYFISLVATDGTDTQSKKADYIKRVLDNYKLKKSETAMIGDTEGDILAAKENSIFSIGITWGYGKENDLIKVGADKICHSPLELEKFIVLDF